MKVVFENRIMSNVLFELMNGQRIWYTDMTPTQKGHADKLLAAQQGVQSDEKSVKVSLIQKLRAAFRS